MKFYSPRLGFILIAVTALLMIGGTARAADSKASQSSLNDGYSIFYDFCAQESQISLLLWFKSAPPKIADYAETDFRHGQGRHGHPEKIRG